MRRAIVILACLASCVVRAQSWELGSSELLPNSYVRLSDLRTASSQSGHLVVWNEQFAGLYAARFSSDGAVLDPLGLQLADVQPSDLYLASDGNAYVVAWNACTARITPSGEVRRTVLTLGQVYIRGLASNGRTYVLVYTAYDTTGSRLEAVLLNRDGIPISGRLVLGGLEDVSITQFGHRWLVAATLAGRGVLGVIGESDFPPYFQTRGLAVEAFLPIVRGSHVAGGRRGYAISWIDFGPQELVVEWHDEEPRSIEREKPGEASRDRRAGRGARRVLRHPMPYYFDVDDYELAVHGSVIYATYNNGPVAGVIRFEEQRSEAIGFLGERQELRVAISHFGGAAFWRGSRDGQIYAARMSDLQIGEPRLVSHKLPNQETMTLVSGGGVHLALWGEDGRPETQYAVLADDGTPVTPALSLPGSHSRALAASDGVSFLVVWNDEGLHGCIVATDGSIVRGPFVILPKEYGHKAQSLAWDGTSYVISRGSELIRIAFDGTLIERSVWPEAGGTLLRTEKGLLAFIDGSSAGPCTCGVNGLLHVVPIGRDLQPDYERDEIWSNRQWEWWSWSGLLAFAVGGGHRFVVRDDLWGDDGFRVAGDDGEFRRVPYSGPFNESLSAMWDGEEFIVTAGARLVRHGPDGAFRGITPLPPGTVTSTVVVDRGRVPIVLTTRVVGGRSRRLLLARLQTASSGSDPAPR